MAPSLDLPLSASVASRPSVRLAPAGTVFLPKEHGSWSLALEPLALGLLVAPSLAGGALAGAVLAGFFARRPLKAALASEASGRRGTARSALLLLATLAVIGLVEAAVLAGGTALWPVLLAVPFGGLFVWFDGRNESRAAAAEFAGCTAFAFVPAALVTLAGRPGAVALALAFLAAARSLPAILTVRSYLRTTKGEPAGGALALWSAVGALAGGVAFVAVDLAPVIAVTLGALLLLHTAWLAGPWRPRWSARRIGQMEAALGLLYVVMIAAGWSSP